MPKKIDNFNIEYIDTLSETVLHKINQSHIKDEASKGVICNYKKFSFVAKCPKGDIIGALNAYTAYAEIYLDDILVEINYRNLGIGKKLLAALENYFKGKGYNNINLVTSQFQAPEFYKKCGFTVEFIRENKLHPELTKFFFIKYLD